MSQDYKSLNQFPIIRNFTANQTWTDVVLPGKAKHITVGCETADIFVTFEGVEGGSTSGTHKMFIRSGGYVAIAKGRGTNQNNSIQVATQTASSAEVTMIFEE